MIPWETIRDPFSMYSHLLGAFLSLFALVALVVRARQRGRDGWAVGSLVVYGLSMAAAFGASALFHAFIASPEYIDFLKRLDHAAIFLLIGGTGTAVYGALAIPRRQKQIFLAGLWLITLGGLAVKMLIWPMPLWLTAATYLSVGWVASLGILAVAREHGWQRLRAFIHGSLVLSVGAVIFALEWPVLWPGVIEGHELFHVIVLAGVGLHFAFVYGHCTRPTAYDHVPAEAPAVAPAPVAIPLDS